ncbi:hypothetical protein FIBSPDRAFT_1036797 [Athelia psychrophila]|uniref:Uncharacterized protein n=1 Tax=Athelia psychrophila TaxID=1759441 RepID=A0A166VGI6_9AGAM|nr:hypothetical protein FIBSPDRAFT_1036797 [Fibularhizoctonia sp. CBS 109695]
MDVLLQDLGTTGVINLYGEQLRESRLRSNELENRLALKTSECEAISRVAQQADANRAALQNELHRLTTEANPNQREPYPKLEPELEEEGLVAWSGPDFEAELAEKDERIGLLAEQLEQQGAHVERLAETLERKIGAEERQARISCFLL